MPKRRTFIVTPIPNLQRVTERGLAFLECREDPGINGRRVYEDLKENKQRLVRNRFDYWLGGGIHDQYFHGWSDPEYKDCFVFKWKDRKHQRLYGFLVNPRPRTDPRFQLCVLISHAQKTTQKTDPSELNGAKRRRQEPVVINVVKRAYPELDLN